ncbi:MAG: 16S rRNA (cytidine(1402)-2'-O)-methyltransferase [Candidatus Gastranaerophilales bacterium]|nr:16S rRNA (cytidine(1402)-2'-O)-methyltransferase [Candidatus Gastranaerophilales bacterium]
MDNPVALYVVATPIGNLSDITLRALEVLKSVDIVACEDTRNTSVLMEKYDIKTRLISYHKYSENQRLELFLNYLKENRSIALVSDAGTPLISDPGNILVKAVLKEGYKVIPVGGISAVVTLLSAISRQGEDFKFIGFLPKGEKQIQETISKNVSENLIFYESPNRLLQTLIVINKNYPEKKITVGRELTKKFEEIKTGKLAEIIEYYKNNILKGEIACLLHKTTAQNIETESKIRKLKSLGYKDKDISIILSNLFDVNKNEIYKRSLDIIITQ